MTLFKRSLLIGFLFITGFELIAQNTGNVIHWSECFGGSRHDFGYNVIQTSDGGYMIGARTTSQDGDQTDGVNHYVWTNVWYVKMDSAFNIQWNKTFGNYNLPNHTPVVCESAFGGYCIAYSQNGHDNCRIGKLDANGQSIWTISAYSYSAHDIIVKDIQEHTNGDIFCVGETSDDHIYVSRFDSTGVLMWEHKIDGNGSGTAESVVIESNGHCTVAGTTSSTNQNWLTNNGGYDFFIMRLNGNGTPLWRKLYGGSSNEFAKDMIRTTNGYAITGRTYSTNGYVSSSFGGYDLWTVNLDNSGNLLWERSVGGSNNEIGNHILESSAGGFLVTGTQNGTDSLNPALDEENVFLTRIDTAGNLIWQKAYGGSEEDQGFSSIEMAPKQFLTCGYTFSANGDVVPAYNTPFGSRADMWLFRTDDDFSTLSGNLFFDQNNSGQKDLGEPNLSYQLISDSASGIMTFTDQNGNYSLYTPNLGNVTIQPVPIANFTVQPTSHTANFTALNQVDSMNDFALQATTVFNDLDVSISGLFGFRPGFNTRYAVSYSNQGTTILNPTIVLHLDTHLTFLNATIPPTSATTDSLIWQLPSLPVLGSGSFLVHCRLDSTTVLGTDITSSIRIEPIVADADSSDNTDTSVVTATGSYDPNDIAVDRERLSPTELLPEPPMLNYLIRFQNTGTDTAFTVRVENDVPSNTDLSTFEFISSSHDVIIDYHAPSENLVFRFENILLPDSNVNEPESHGFIRYRIRPVDSLSLGDELSTFAAIYFDFNQPVITNTATTTIAEPYLQLKLQAMLDGPYDTSTGLMYDSLVVNGLLSTNGNSAYYSSYPPIGTTTSNFAEPPLFSVTGPNAIVDWIVVELRSADSIAVPIHRKYAMIQRDGDLVDLNGSHFLELDAPFGNYHVVLRHRNHLGVMSAAPITLNDIPTTLDFSDPTFPTWGINATKFNNGVQTLWSGNVQADGIVKYTGTSNDRDPILLAIGGNAATATITGYERADVNMDGVVKYTGTNNDRDPILVNVGGNIPTAVIIEQLP